MKQGDIFSYMDMCQKEGTTLQRGMNFRIKRNYSIILMSLRENAPYADKIEDNGKILIYEGHDIQKNHTKNNPKFEDQPEKNPSGSLTQNGQFNKAAQEFKNGKKPELVKVYEKLRAGVWTFNGIFKLIDSWIEKDVHRNVYKFKLSLTDKNKQLKNNKQELEHNRLIPAHVKREVWIRDKGKCIVCGSQKNLHFDHIIPFSKGGSSLVAENIQLMCAKHNLQKRDKIE